MKDNVLFAEFLKWKVVSVYSYLTPFYTNYLAVGGNICETSIIHRDELMFDKSWDWLMLVVKRIREITNVELGIHDFECVRDMRLNLNPYDYTREQVYESSLKFIKWYNNRDAIMSCPHVIRVGESCRLNNDCTYPNCKPLTNNQLLGQSTII